MIDERPSDRSQETPLELMLETLGKGWKEKKDEAAAAAAAAAAANDNDAMHLLFL